MFHSYRNQSVDLLQLICRANQLTGFYMMGTLVVKSLNDLNDTKDYWPFPTKSKNSRLLQALIRIFDLSSFDQFSANIPIILKKINWLPMHIKLAGIYYLYDDALRDLYNLKNVKNTHGWRLKPATLLKVILLYRCFSRFLNCKNSTKLDKSSPMMRILALNRLRVVCKFHL